MSVEPTCTEEAFVHRSTDPLALIGRVVADRYRLEQLLGQGGFGAVYRATHLALGRTVAVKISLVERPGLLARFEREARVQAGIRHPGCVFLLDYGQEPGGLVYMVQEFVDGRSLQQVLAIERRLEPLRAIELTGQVLDALHEAHEHGVVHRDIKPGNVMLTRTRSGREEARVLDFGIAKVIGEETDDRLTATGIVLGTPTYMAPEQIRQREVGPPTDVYAVGCMLYRMLAGRAPFTGDSQYDIVRQHIDTPVPPLPRDLFGLDPIIARAMAKDPHARYATAGEMRDALAMALGPPTCRESLPPIAAAPEPSDPAETGDARRYPWLPASALIAAAFLAGALLMGEREPTPAAGPSPVDAAPLDLGRPDAMPRDAIPHDAGSADAVADVTPLDAAVDATPRIERAARRSAPRHKPRGSSAPRASAPTPIERPPTVERPPRAAPSRTRVGSSTPRAALSPEVERAARSIRNLLARCHCNVAQRDIRRLAQTSPKTAMRLESEWVEECEVRLPGNCLDQQIEDREKEEIR